MTLQIRAGTCETHGPAELESAQGAFSKARTPPTLYLAKVDQYLAQFQLEHQEEHDPTRQNHTRYYPIPQKPFCGPNIPGRARPDRVPSLLAHRPTHAGHTSRHPVANFTSRRYPVWDQIFDYFESRSTKGMKLGVLPMSLCP